MLRIFQYKRYVVFDIMFVSLYFPCLLSPLVLVSWSCHHRVFIYRVLLLFFCFVFLFYLVKSSKRRRCSDELSFPVIKQLIKIRCVHVCLSVGPIPSAFGAEDKSRNGNGNNLCVSPSIVFFLFSKLQTYCSHLPVSVSMVCRPESSRTQIEY